MKKIIVLLLIFTACFNILSANVLTVGFKDSKYQTIKEAINEAKPYDTIKLAAKEYNEALTINRPITIEGNNAVLLKEINILSVQRLDIFQKYNVVVKDLTCKFVYVYNSDFRLINIKTAAEFIGIYAENSYKNRGAIEKCFVKGIFPNEEYKEKTDYQVENEGTMPLIDGTFSSTGMMFKEMGELILVDNTIANCSTGIIIEAVCWGNYPDFPIPTNHFIKNNIIKDCYNGIYLSGVDTTDYYKEASNRIIVIEKNNIINSLNYAILVDNYTDITITENNLKNNKSDIIFNRKVSEEERNGYKFTIQGINNVTDNEQKYSPINIFESGFFKK